MPSSEPPPPVSQRVLTGAWMPRGSPRRPCGGPRRRRRRGGAAPSGWGARTPSSPRSRAGRRLRGRAEDRVALGERGVGASRGAACRTARSSRSALLDDDVLARARRGDGHRRMQCDGTHRSTTSTSESPRMARKSGTTAAAPASAANARARSGRTAATARRSTVTPRTCRYPSAWSRATKPAPTIPTRTRGRSRFHHGHLLPSRSMPPDHRRRDSPKICQEGPICEGTAPSSGRST